MSEDPELCLWLRMSHPQWAWPQDMWRALPRVLGRARGA